jgi:predicted transcriptional regulator
VVQIAQLNVMSSAPDQDASDVLANRALADFDQIPVRHKSCVIGVL